MLEAKTDLGVAKRAGLNSMIDKHNPAIVCIQESGLRPQIKKGRYTIDAEKFNLKGYTIFRHDLPAGGTSGHNRGIFTAFKDNIGTIEI